MRIISFLPAGFFFLSLLSCSPRDRYVSLSGFAQGGTWTVKYNAGPVKERESEVQSAIESILSDVDFSLSGYNHSSVLSRLNAGETVRPDSVFMNMYALSYRFWQLSDGALDAAAGPLFDIWGFGFTSESMPSPGLIGRTLSSCGMARLRAPSDLTLAADGTLNAASMLAQGVTGELPRLNFNAIAQGYSCDLVAAYLHSIGVRDMLVDIGEIFCEGHNPSGKGWTIGIDAPVDGNNMPGAHVQAVHTCSPEPQGVVTSGNYRKFYIRDSVKYSHTVDPRTGYPVQHSLLSATVVAPTGAEADAVATICMVIGTDAAREYILSHGYEGYLVYDEGGVMRDWASPGFTLTSR